ncbi:putative bifunctional diguanylate cyclase/phosphodiesterase [Paraburkholderia strydomiana]
MQQFDLSKASRFGTGCVDPSVRPIAYVILFAVVLVVEIVFLQLNVEGNDYLGVKRLAGNSQQRAVTELFHIYVAATFLIGLFMLHNARERFRLEARLSYQAIHDPLTGLPNRRALEKTLQALSSKRKCFVLGCIDRFERITTELGLAASETLLSSFARRLSGTVSQTEGLLFKLDGEKFGILFLPGTLEREVETTVELVQSTMRSPFLLGDSELYLTLSMGFAVAPCESPGSPDLLRHASIALQAAQRRGGDSHAPYRPECSSVQPESIWMEAALRHALEQGELKLYYQPQQRLADGAVAGFEALLRWDHQGRRIPPVEFIPLAEQSGQIVEIGYWVLRKACAQAKAWRATYRCQVIVAVNISPRQFQHPEFVSRVKAIVDETGVNPADIELEITEGMMLERAEKVIAMLEDLRRIGLRISIDDFGTGYSSLSYLTRLPIDRIKIDRAFLPRG